MDAFHGNDEASLAFKAELLRLAPSYTLKDLYNAYHSTPSRIREEGTARSKKQAHEKIAVQRVQPLMQSFLDLSLAHNRLPGTRLSFEITSEKWLTLSPMVHPQFGHFKFLYSPFGMIDYESFFRREDNTLATMSNIVSYPRPASSWLHVLPKVPTEIDDNESEIIENTGQIIQYDINYLKYNSEGATTLEDSTIITQIKSSEPPERLVYVPPHKRRHVDSAHSRTQYESLPANNDILDI
ncbi:hypothetical protein NHQ30_004488 [Ciborinia camelliae]|nr:hypothetical protein NHQ30_004488 [Ciborinia camelliae]